MLSRMCRNIRLLHNFEPPTTDEEVRDAALQFVRKVSGVRAPAVADEAAFTRAVEDIAATTRALLGALPKRGPTHTREKEKDKARMRWAAREARVRATAK